MLVWRYPDGTIRSVARAQGAASAGGRRDLLFRGRVAYGGDSAYFARPFFGGNPAAPASPNPPVYETIAYFSEVDPRDPLVSPVLDPKMLARFPPTLLITGSRDFMLSSAVHTHAQLVKAGVHADLHILEGMWHAFFYSVDMPESKQAYEIIARFFNERLGGASSSCP
jgi:epsilon-lactone hydrolase